MPADPVVSVSGTERGHDTRPGDKPRISVWCRCKAVCADVPAKHDRKGAVCRGLPASDGRPRT